MKVQKSAKQSDLAFSTDDCWLGFLIISRNLMFHNVSKEFRVQFHQNGGEFLAVASPIATDINGSNFGTSTFVVPCQSFFGRNLGWAPGSHRWKRAIGSCHNVTLKNKTAFYKAVKVKLKKHLFLLPFRYLLLPKCLQNENIIQMKH